MIVFLIYIGISCLFGFSTWKIASDKGHDSAGYFWLGFFLEIFGLIIVACLSNQKHYVTSEPRHTDGSSYFDRLERERRESETVRQWECGYCGGMNSNTLNYCVACRRERFVAIKIPCPSCGAINPNTNSTCWVCDKPMQGLQSSTDAPSQSAIIDPYEHNASPSIDFDTTEAAQELLASVKGLSIEKLRELIDYAKYLGGK